MNKANAISACNEYGEFYMYYEKLRLQGVATKKDITYLQGTTEFDLSQDKYLAARFAKENIQPADDKHVLVFSRTNDSFRYIPAKNIRRITSLNAGLDKAAPVQRKR